MLLPLTAFEEYMLCDDRPAFPMTGMARLSFSGTFDVPAFERSVALVVARHPLLRATVERSRLGRPRWKEHPDWRPSVVWHAKAGVSGFPNAPFMDLASEPGVRFWVVDRANGQDLILQIHHSCSDGIGMTRLIEDLLVAYAAEIDPGGAVSLDELQPEQLRRRGAPGMTFGQLIRSAPKQAVGLLGVREFFMRRPVPLTQKFSRIEEGVPPEVFPVTRSYQFCDEETRKILQAARSAGVTVNDWMLRDLFLAVGAWRRARSLGTDKDWLRFSIPMNLRRAEEASMPVANSVSMVFVDRRGDDLNDPAVLLEGIHQQMMEIKRLDLRYTLIFSLGISRWIPGGLASQTASDRCCASSCLSNVGRVLMGVPLPRREGRIVAGNVVLDGIDFVIPLRPQMNAAFCLCTYAGRLRLLMHVDPRRLSEDDTTTLLQAYVDQVRRSIGCGAIGAFPGEEVACGS